MQKYILAALMLLTACISEAQNNRTDTVMLSVYNTGSRYRLIPANFGSLTPRIGVIETAIVLPDSSVNVPIAQGQRLPDSTIRRKMDDIIRNPSANRGTNLISGRRTCSLLFPQSVKGKMVIIETDIACDDSEKCLAAQKAGASGIIVIFPTENINSIRMNGGRYKKDITIPCYSITQKEGEAMRAQLPSKVAIKPTTSTTQNSIAQPPVSNTIASASDKTATTTDNSETAQTDAATNSLIKRGFTVSPNPARNQVNVTYQFPNATDATIEVKTASGQVINRQLLRGVTIGSLPISTVDYASGTYFVTLQYGKEVQTKKLIVRK